jgi:hypothetical protein
MLFTGTKNAASTGTIELGDQTSDNQAASLRLANAGMTIANTITTNVDQTGTDNQRTIAGAYASGSSTLSGTINVNGGTATDYLYIWMTQTAADLLHDLRDGGAKHTPAVGRGDAHHGAKVAAVRARCDG